MSKRSRSRGTLGYRAIVEGAKAIVGGRGYYARRYAHSRPKYNRRGGFYGRNRVLNKGEMKYYDIAMTDTGAVATWLFVGNAIGWTDYADYTGASLNLIKQGSGAVERIGRRCFIRSIFMRYRADLAIYSANTVWQMGTQRCRMMLFLDTQCNGAAPTAATMFTRDGFHTFNDLENKGRYKTLFNKVVTCGAPMNLTHNGTNPEYFRDEWQGRLYTYRKKCNIKIEFDSATPAIGNVRRNNLVFGWVQHDTPSVSVPQCLIFMECRLRFTD